MIEKETIYLSENLLNGRPENFRLIKPVLIAQLILKNADKTETDIPDIGKQLFDTFEKYKTNHTEVYARDKLLNDEAPIEDEPWLCAILGNDNDIDLFDCLKQVSYQPLLDLINKYSEALLLATLIILLARDSDTKGLLESARNDNKTTAAIFKAVAELYWLKPSTNINEIIEILHDTFKKMIPEITQNIKKAHHLELSQRGGLNKAEVFNETREETIRLFNEGKYPSMLNGAENIAPKVIEFDRKKKGLMSSKNPVRTLKDWLSKANKEGKLYKKFS